MDDLKKTLCDTLRNVLQDIPGTQHDLAALLETSQPRICTLLNGKKDPQFSVQQILTWLIKLGYTLTVTKN